MDARGRRSLVSLTRHLADRASFLRSAQAGRLGIREAIAASHKAGASVRIKVRTHPTLLTTGTLTLATWRMEDGDPLATPARYHLTQENR